MKKLIVLIICAMMLSAGEPDLKLKVDDKHYFIGDRINIDISIKGSPQQMYVLPDVREWLKDVYIVDVNNDEKVKKDIKTTSMHIEVAGFDTGFVHIPAMPVVSTDSTGFGKPDTFYTPEKYVYIYSILDSSAAPVAMTPPLPLALMTWWELLIALILLSAAIVILYFGIKNRGVKKTEPEEIWESPKDKAEHYLDALNKKQYPQKEQWKKFYLELTYIAREYFENIYYIHLKELTTTDLLPVLNEHIDGPYKARLQEFFQFADIVKFAKGLADRELCDSHFRLIKEIVEKDEGENIDEEIPAGSSH